MLAKFAAELLDEVAEDCESKSVLDEYSHIKQQVYAETADRLTNIIEKLVESERF